MKTNNTRDILLFFLVFLGLGAMVGGLALMISPSGELLGMPASMRAKSYFSSFLVPGVVLFLVLGITPLLLAFALFKKPVSKFAEQFNYCYDMHWAWTYCIYMTIALIIWIQVEMAFFQVVHELHIFYVMLALVILLVTLLPQIRRHYKK
jgi:hypothetical protein